MLQAECAPRYEASPVISNIAAIARTSSRYYCFSSGEAAVRRSIKLLLAACLSFGTIPSASAQIGAGQDLGGMLAQAQKFTVKVRGTVIWPFVPEQVGMGTGTGFIIDVERGWVLTNAHVARRSHSAVEVAFGDVEHQWAPVERVYVDNHLDIAVLKVASDKLPEGSAAAKLGCNQVVKQGGAIVAYGHPINLNFTATRGIVSSVRTLGSQEFVQMDASINPGNSGGPLLALDSAEVVGINTANFPGLPGLGLAVAIRHVCPIIDLLVKGEDPSLPSLPVYWLKQGRVETLTVAAPHPREASDKAGADIGLMAGDVVHSIVGGAKLAGVPHLDSTLRGRKGTVNLQVMRAGKLVEVSVPLIPAKQPMKRRALAMAGLLITERVTLDTSLSVLPPLRVEYIRPGEAGARAGFAAGDHLHMVGDRRFTSVAALHDWLKTRQPRERISILVRRSTNVDPRITAEYHKLEIQVSDLRLLGPDGGT